MLHNIVGNMESGVERRVDANKKFLESTAHELIAGRKRTRTLSPQKNNFPVRGLADDATRKELR
jgi:hypothetical protein